MSGFAVLVREAGPNERRAVEELHGAPLASDHCVLVRIGAGPGTRIVGWGDDYGTFHPISAEKDPALNEAGERLLWAVQEFWGAAQ